MNKIEKLIKEYCPDGVEYKELGELGYFYSGLSGKTKQDFDNGNCKFVTYKNIYNNFALDINIKDTVFIDKKEIQNTIKYGDILFTASSEIREECGFSSVVNKQINEDIYLNSFCFGYRLNNNLFLPNFLKHLFRSDDIRKLINKTANGVTRFNISKDKFSKIEIPIPPIAIQEEIVNILDTFTELEAELVLRKKQYEYYRDKLLTFSPDDSRVKWVSLSELGIFIRGNGLQKKDFTSEGVGCIHYGQIYTYYKTFTDKTKSFVSKQLANKLKKAKPKDLIIATTSENVRDVAKAVAWLGDEEICISGDACIFRHNQNSKYMSYLFQTQSFFKHKKNM